MEYTFLCGSCTRELNFSLDERLKMSKRLFDGSVCERCKTTFYYKKGSFVKEKSTGEQLKLEV